MPTDEKLPDGRYKHHWALPEEERKAGYMRPLRTEYKHVGMAGPKYRLRDLTPEETEQYHSTDYVKYEEYPEGESAVGGRYWTPKELESINKGRGVITRMPMACAETYAKNPRYYGSTFCCGRGDYFRVDQFVWIGLRGARGIMTGIEQKIVFGVSPGNGDGVQLVLLGIPKAHGST